VTLSVAPGQQTLDLPLSIPGKTGATVVRFTFEGGQRELLVVVGDPATIKVPALTAPAVGVEIRR
jgi:hypothetical protein